MQKPMPVLVVSCVLIISFCFVPDGTASVKEYISEAEFLAEDAYNLAKRSSEADNLEQARMFAKLAMQSAEGAKDAAANALAEYTEKRRRPEEIPFLE